MNGLLIKDLYTLIKQMKLYLVTVLVFACLPEAMFCAFGIVYSAMLPITAMAYDERSKWTELAAMLPYSARAMTASRYVLGYICVGFSAAVTLLVKLLVSVITRTPLTSATLMFILFSAALALALMALILPCIFHFGVEKGRMAYILACGVVGGLAGMGILTGAVTEPTPLLPLLSALAAAVLNLLSIELSTRLYVKKRGK